MQHLTNKWQAIRKIRGRIMELGHLPSQILTPMERLMANKKFTMKYIPTILLKILPNSLGQSIKDKHRFHQTRDRQKSR
jgi:hypothetical protein